MTRGAAGSTAATADEVVTTPGFDVRCRDGTGAGDAFVGGLAFGLASRWSLDDTLRLANAVGALATTALGSQSGHPSLQDACGLADLDHGSSSTG
jgi:sugar/nucleoside kinase (ribokinase family)